MFRIAVKPRPFVIIIQNPDRSNRPLLEFDIQNHRTGEQLTGRYTTFEIEKSSDLKLIFRKVFKICRCISGTQDQLEEWLEPKLPAWLCVDQELLSNRIGINAPKIGWVLISNCFKFFIQTDLTATPK